MSKRQTVFFLLVDPMYKNHKDPDVIDLSVPPRAQYVHKALKRRQDAENWVDINLVIEKGLKFHQTRSNAIILHETLPAFCIPKVVRMQTGEVMYEKVYASPRPPPKISLKHDWMKDLGSEVARQPEGEVARQANSSQSSRPNPNPDHDRTGKLVVCPQRGAHRSQEIETRSFREEAVKHDRTGNLLFAVMKITSASPLSALSKHLIHISLVTARTSIWKTKQITIERGNLLFAVMQITSAQC